MIQRLGFTGKPALFSFVKSTRPMAGSNGQIPASLFMVQYHFNVPRALGQFSWFVA
jgi:hypothetical protein